MQQAEKEIRQWLQQVVIGQNLCPFAARPWQQQQIRIQMSDCEDEACLLQALFDEIHLLEELPASETETTLLVATHVLQVFDDFNQFLDLAEQLLINRGWQGKFQLATFHPQYQFQGTSKNAAENLTNQSPYPVLHILREDSVEKVLSNYQGDPQQIPQSNIERMQALSIKERQALFSYLFKDFRER